MADNVSPFVLLTWQTADGARVGRGTPNVVIATSEAVRDSMAASRWTAPGNGFRCRLETRDDDDVLIDMMRAMYRRATR
jgi:hypothetical protein